MIKQSSQTVGAIVGKSGDSSQKIGAIVETIDDIAEQINLLALNAATNSRGARPVPLFLLLEQALMKDKLGRP